jgi:hypothetical protein
MVLAGPPGGSAFPGGSGAMALAAPDTGGGAAATGGSAAQAAPAASVVPGQSTLMVASDGSGGGRSSSPLPATVPAADARTAAAEPLQAGRSFTRNVMATILPQAMPAPPAGEPVPAAAGQGEAPPSPRGADLIAEALPFAGDSLERSLEEFVTQLERGDVVALVTDPRAPMVVAALAMVTTAATAMVAREVVRRRSARGRGLRLLDPLGRELALSFPELPRSWSEKRR